MSDLIDREALLKRLHDAGGCGAPAESWADGYDKAIDLAYGMAENAPAVDAALVVHGRWEPFRGKSYSRKECSCCGWDGQEWIKFYNFCPNCGAKMNGGNDNDCQRGDCSF